MSARRIGIFLIGINGSIGTTVTSGVYAIARGMIEPFGLVTELPAFEALDLPPLSSLRFYGWDLRTEPHLKRVQQQSHIPRAITEFIEDDLKEVQVFRAPRIGISKHILSLSPENDSGSNLTRVAAVENIKAAIEATCAADHLSGAVVINIASTEEFTGSQDCYDSLRSFRDALNNDNPAITSGMLYAYAALSAGVPYINFTPSTTVDIPALIDLADEQKVVIAGKDGKTGQTLYKSVLGPMFRWRNLRVCGWYSNNILGNDDGYVLKNPAHRSTKLASKNKGLAHILGYDDFHHQINIDYYPPRGDAKEAWDVIDFVGWLGTSMSMRVNWIGQDSALAAPLIVDIARLVRFAQDQGESGPASHLAAFFKDPMNAEHHGFEDQMRSLIRYCEEKTSKALGFAVK